MLPVFNRKLIRKPKHKQSRTKQKQKPIQNCVYRGSKAVNTSSP